MRAEPYRLFCSVLEWALGRRTMRVRREKVDLENGGKHLVALRVADDILVFATSTQQAAYMLADTVVALVTIGLMLTYKGNDRLDREHHLQAAAARVFLANRYIFCNKTMSLVKQLHFFVL